MYALIAAIPIFLTVILMVGFNWPAKRALPASWLIACFVAGFIWKMGILEIGAQTLAGFLSAFETLAIIFWCNLTYEYFETIWRNGFY